MARIEVSTHVEAAPERVWEVLADWEGQAAWMRDARSVTVLGDQREGPGVRLLCPTNIFGGIVVDDVLIVTEWDPPALLGVAHEGRLIRGVGAFELTPTPQGTHVVWWEEIALPLGQLGEWLAGAAVVAWVERVFRGSLAGLKRLAESRSVRPQASGTT